MPTNRSVAGPRAVAAVGAVALAMVLLVSVGGDCLIHLGDTCVQWR